jgi:hypothetical protein
MTFAVSQTLVVVLTTVGRLLISSQIRVLFASFPSAAAWAMSVSVMMPIGRSLQASRTIRAVAPVCFIR